MYGRSNGLSGIGSSRRWRKANSGIDESGGTIIINGGNIHAKGQDSASAIGECGEIPLPRHRLPAKRKCGSITINGGIVRTEALARKELLSEVLGSGPTNSVMAAVLPSMAGRSWLMLPHDAICTGRGGSITINGGDITARGGLGRTWPWKWDWAFLDCLCRHHHQRR